jgi:hypothetical protein
MGASADAWGWGGVCACVKACVCAKSCFWVEVQRSLSELSDCEAGMWLVGAYLHAWLGCFFFCDWGFFVCACVRVGCFCEYGSLCPGDFGYLVDPASSHMLVSKIKPCMSKYKHFYTVKLRTAHYISNYFFDGTLLHG